MWVNLCEFLRNEFLFKEPWLEKYRALGLNFPSAPINGVLWLVWGFLFALCIVVLRRKLSFAGTFLLGWTMGFVLMWLVIGNLNVFPLGLLPIAVPWSLVEVALAVLLAQTIIGSPGAEQHAGKIPSKGTLSELSA